MALVTGHASAVERGVREEAAVLEGRGWTVTAQAEGYTTPREVAGMRPTPFAEKGDRTRLVEVFEEGERNAAREDALRDGADALDATYYVVQVDERGSREGYDYQRD